MALYKAAQKMAKGGVRMVKKCKKVDRWWRLFVASTTAPTPAATPTSPTTIGDATTQRMFNPALPQGGVTQLLL